MIGLAMKLGLTGVLHLHPVSSPPVAPPAPVVTQPAATPPVPVAVAVRASSPRTTPTPAPAAPTTTTTTSPPPPVSASCALTWTTTETWVQAGTNQSGPPGLTGTWSVACSNVAAVEGTFPPNTIFSVAPDPGPNP